MGRGLESSITRRFGQLITRRNGCELSTKRHSDVVTMVSDKPVHRCVADVSVFGGGGVMDASLKSWTATRTKFCC